MDKDTKEVPATAKLVIAIWSNTSPISTSARSDLQFSLEAWESDRLFLVKIGDTELPVGLRDIYHHDYENLPYEEIAKLIASDAWNELFGPPLLAQALPRNSPARGRSYFALLMGLFIFLTVSIGSIAWYQYENFSDRKQAIEIPKESPDQVPSGYGGSGSDVPSGSQAAPGSGSSDDSRVSPAPPPEPPLPRSPPPSAEPFWRVSLVSILNIKIPLLWAIGLTLLAGVGITGTLAMLKRRHIESNSPPAAANGLSPTLDARV